MNALATHEIATLFPRMSDVDLNHLKASLLQEGQIEDILVFEGKILDGRHRYETCLEIGIEPRLREFSGDRRKAFSHSVALNLGRRHLTTVQRAAAGAGIKVFQQRLLSDSASPSRPDETARADVEPSPKTTPKPSPKRINARARELASQQSGVSKRAIDVAEKIKEEAPDVFERMLAGTAGSLPDAKRVTSLPAEIRLQVHALVDEGTKLKAAIKQVAPEPPAPPGPVFLGKVILDPQDARAFDRILADRDLKRVEAAKEALLDWIRKHS
ncbi:MAG: ParB N-terminal domain-containing protein [Planctomycetes bacterium]|nr:ParB N-terminal domain-containing protein [Planctomycetota bacterium]